MDIIYSRSTRCTKADFFFSVSLDLHNIQERINCLLCPLCSVHLVALRALQVSELPLNASLNGWWMSKARVIENMNTVDKALFVLCMAISQRLHSRFPESAALLTGGHLLGVTLLAGLFTWVALTLIDADGRITVALGVGFLQGCIHFACAKFRPQHLPTVYSNVLALAFALCLLLLAYEKRLRTKRQEERRRREHRRRMSIIEEENRELRRREEERLVREKEEEQDEVRSWVDWVHGCNDNDPCSRESRERQYRTRREANVVIDQMRRQGLDRDSTL